MKRYLTLTVIFWTLITAYTFAQCPQTDILLTSQQEIDDFAINYPGCTELTFRLTINDSLTTPIYNLDGLAQITAMRSILLIQDNDSLTSLSGLQNLDYIASYLGIVDNDNLITLSGLENASDSISSIIIDDNINLVSLEGLDNLSNTGEFEIKGNESLTSLAGLENLDFVSFFWIYNNNSLTSLTGLENLSSVGALRINVNESLTSLTGLENLNSANSINISNENLTSLNGLENLNSTGSLGIGGTVDLTSLAGLENLDSVATLTIGNNAKLITLEGIDNINPEFINILLIADNPKLSDCAIESICQYIIEPESETYIENNAQGCDLPGEIAAVCSLFWDYTLEGNIFMDTNEDCIRDTSELNLSGWLIRVDGDQGTNYAYTYDNGKYLVPLDSGIFTVSPIPPNSLWEDVCFPTSTIELTPSNTRDTIDFGANTNTFCPLLEIDVAAPFVRRCFDSNYYIQYCNSGTAVAENAYVEVQLDPFFTYQSSTITGIDLGDNLYSFDLENVEVGECGSFRIGVYVDCDSTVLGQTHCVEAHIFPDSICSPSLPIWDEASIEVDAQCLGDSIEFKIENIGTGDMSDSLEYFVIEDDLMWPREKFKLNSGANKVFYQQANGAFYRLEAEQSPGHPGNSMPSVFVEGCGEGDDGEISIGFVNYYLLNEGDAFVSIDCQQNVGSYDPNDKQAFPVGYGVPHYITDSTDLEYFIRFQNTGTDTAFNIIIRDTISPHLNIETLRPIVASHPYRYDIEGSNIAVFHFENIMLPDSNVNEAVSHGFIKFNIEQKNNNPIGTHIMNDAAIYFDFNEPIITNTVFHTVGEDFMGIITSVITPPEVKEAGILVHVFPNPFDKYTRFEIKDKIVKELHLTLYDVIGHKVLQQSAANQQYITLSRNNLPSGMYAFRLMDEKQQLATGKLVIQ